MKRAVWMAAAMIAMGAMPGCSSSSDSNGPQAGSGGTSEGGTGGADASAGGAGGTSTGGTSTGGTAGSEAGGEDATEAGAGGEDAGTGGTQQDSGTGGAATGGTAGSAGGDGFWTHPYDPVGAPPVASGHHNASQDCLGCHDGTGTATQFLFGGTIYDALGTAPVEHAEIGIKDPGGFYSSYSGTNGNFWGVAAGTTIDWSQAEIRTRDAYGELTMPVTPQAGCNSCHKGSAVINAF